MYLLVMKVCKNCHLNHKTDRETNRETFMVYGISSKAKLLSHYIFHLKYACICVYFIFCLVLAVKMYHLSVVSLKMFHLSVVEPYSHRTHAHSIIYMHPLAFVWQL